MTYNLTNFTASNNPLELAIASNQLVGGWMFTLIVLLIYVISFIALKRYETKYAMLTAGFVTFVLSVSLWGAGVVGDGTVIVVLVIFLLSLAFSAFSD